MGGNKSKPIVTEVVETARETIARRKLLENGGNKQVISNISQSINSNSNINNSSSDPFIANLLKDNNNYVNKNAKLNSRNTGGLSHEIDSDIIDQIASWNMITTHYDKPGEVYKNKDMAILVRHNEERSLSDEEGYMPKLLTGRLTEDQIISLFKQKREKDGISDVQLAGDFKLSVEVIRSITQINKYPIIFLEGKDRLEVAK